MAKPRVLCLGELLIDLCAVDADVPLAEVGTFVRVPGGAPANVAVGLARLGCQAGFVGAVGDDFFGRYLRQVLAANGVDTSHLLVTREARTTLAFIANDTSGEKAIEFYRQPGADMLLTEAAISAAYLDRFDAVHFGSISLVDDGPRAATLRARQLAIDRGALTTFDVNWRPALWPDTRLARERILSAATGVSIVKLSDEEWEAALGVRDFAAGAGALLDRGVALVVRTEGANGASFAGLRARGHVPAFHVDVVDSLGAGDAFMAGLIGALGSRQLAAGDLRTLGADEAERAIREAHAAAALTTLAKGAMPALPTERAVQEFLRSAVTVS
jgi:fructokinase